MMKISRFVVPIALVWAAVSAQAHTVLSASKPANEDVVTASPQELILTFSTEVRLTALSMLDGAGHTVELGSLPDASRKEFVLAIPVLESGDYTVSWRAVGADTHVVSGEFEFVVATESTAGL